MAPGHEQRRHPSLYQSQIDLKQIWMKGCHVAPAAGGQLGAEQQPGPHKDEPHGLLRHIADGIGEQHRSGREFDIDVPPVQHRFCVSVPLWNAGE